MRVPNRSKFGTPRSQKSLRLEQLEARQLLAGDVFRSITGEGNNVANPIWGEADTQLVRLLDSDYADGRSAPAGADRPSPRVISNLVHAQSGDVFNDRQLTDFVWAWGQFIDHDLDLTEPGKPDEPFPIPVPAGDPFFDPAGTGTQEIPLNRSIFDPATGAVNPREQLNEITAYIDASNVYGSDPVRAAALRTFNGGQLKMSAGELLPFNTGGLPNANDPRQDPTTFFLAGDIRANENVMLSSMHTLFVREHNRLAQQIAQQEYAGQNLGDPTIDEELYQRTRQIVGAQLQAITYYEFLPAVLGAGTIGPDSGYDPTVNAGILNEFSTAAFRVGHTMLSPELQRLDAQGASIGAISLRDAFNNPLALQATGIDVLLRGAGSQLMQEVDPLVIDDLRNFLFGPPGQGGLDLPSLNIQRGRDHGLPGYNEAREQLGLGAVSSFSQISSDPNVVARLQAAYASVDDIDFWTGGLSEDHLAGRSMGALFSLVMEQQFFRTRAGDRFWYERSLSPVEAAQVSNTRLSDIIARNTAVTTLQENVFLSHSVFYFRPDVGSGIDTLRLSESGGVVRLRDGSGGLLLERPASEIESIVIEGPVDGSPTQLELNLHWLPSKPISVGGLATLLIDGTPAKDTVVIGQRQIEVNGQSIPFADVGQIHVKGRGGDDLLDGRQSTTPLWLDGAVGDDTIYGGHAGDTLYGGADDDFVSAGGGDDHVDGGSGHDNLLGGDGRDHLFAGTGNDAARGNAGHDYLYGQDGDDYLAGDDGNDYLQGGAGNDLMTGGWGNDAASGQEGQDQIYGDQGDDSLLGGSHNDELHGGPGVDYIRGEDGDDTAYGGDGNDVVLGDNGQDWLYGGNDNDLLSGGTGDDHLHGESGNDSMHGHAGNDRMYGQGGDDLMFGYDGDDYLEGGAGHDNIRGHHDHDELKGSSGNDYLVGGEGNDTVMGEDGDDEAHGGWGDDLVQGGHGRDILGGGYGRDVLEGDDGDDELSGGDQDDTLRGGAGNDYVLGGNGDDTAYGDSGDDIVKGTAGNDRLHGGDGRDSIYGGDGNDEIYGDGDRDFIDAGSGNDVAYGGHDNDVMRGEAGDDTMHGEHGDDLMVGGPGADSMHGGAGHDQLNGDDGHDYLEGNAGDDRLYAGPGNDVLRGDDGHDLMYGWTGRDILHGGQGNDVMRAGPDDDLLVGSAGDDQMQGEAGNDVILAGQGDDWASGGDGSDLLAGNHGVDALQGDDGDDHLFGGAQFDTLNGYGGDDLLVDDHNGANFQGGAGNDILIESLQHRGDSEALLTRPRLDAVYASYADWLDHWFVLLSPDIVDDLPPVSDLETLL